MRLLEAFFRRDQTFALTGGGALAAYYLGHRATDDLDLFTAEASLDDGDRTLADAAAEVGGAVEALRTAPGFRRRLVRTTGESVIVDLVRDAVVAGAPEKKVFGAVRVDSVEEILANKLCAILGRAEIRDLVDVLALERSGLRVEDALPLAARKDAGLTPAQLAWVLSDIRIGDHARIPGGVAVDELREYLAALEARLTQLGFPAPKK